MEMKPLYEWLGLTASLGFIDIPDYEYEAGEKQNYMHMTSFILQMVVWALIILQII